MHIDDLQFTQDWTLDATGNWNRLVQCDPTDAANNLDQSRWQNRANEIVAIVRRYGEDWATPTYDRNGNMTTIPKPLSPDESFAGVYDPWNRLVEVRDGGTTVASYRYDGLNRRVTVDDGTNSRHCYYSSGWQALEERLDSDTTPNRQFVWGLRYIDDLVLRDRSHTGTLDERLYALQDANWNVTAIVDASGDVQERYRYTPYGFVTFLNPSFAPTSTTDSVKDWETLYAGYYWAWEGGWYLVRNRILHSTLGRWLTRDPTARPQESSLGVVLDETSHSLLAVIDAVVRDYEYGDGDPLSSVDPNGLISVCVVPCHTPGPIPVPRLNDCNARTEGSLVTTSVTATCAQDGTNVPPAGPRFICAHGAVGTKSIVWQCILLGGVRPGWVGVSGNDTCE